MAKNAYLKKLRAEREIYADALKQVSMDMALKLTLIAMNDELGIGRERAQRVWQRFNALNDEFKRLSADGYDIAMEKVNQRVQQILGDEILEVTVRV